VIPWGCGSSFDKKRIFMEPCSPPGLERIRKLAWSN
jgi:hypothetical protein